MYRFKFYFNNGTTKLSDAKSNSPNKLLNNIKGEVDWDAYNNLYKKKMNTKEVLNAALSIYKGFINDFYRIEIVNDETNEAIDFVGKPKKTIELYRFKIYFKDGTSSISNIGVKKPKELYNDFDGLMDWDEFENLQKKDLTTKQILKLAFKVYKESYKKEYYKIEIINDNTNEIIDFIEEMHTI